VLTSDHVFPVSWYPKTTPDDLEKWQMPSCNECNKKYGKIEEELLLKFGLCVMPFSYESFGIAEKTLRALNPNKGKNNRDIKFRQKKREKIIREAIDPTTVPITSIFPNFGFYEGIEANNQLAVLVPEKGLKAIGKKLIRGITWIDNKKYIERKYEIGIYFFHEQDAGHFKEPLKRFGKKYSLGPGICITRAMAHEDHICGLYSLEIWGQFKMYGVVNLLKNGSSKNLA
jgi:hypothetical protein